MPPNPPVTLLYTNSYDGTSDLLVSKLGGDAVFRLNFDLWRDYKIRITPADFDIQNPLGRRIDGRIVAKVYWRKPSPTREIFPERPVSQAEVYMEEELWYALRDVIALLWSDGRVVLVEPFAELRVGKIVQLRVAADLFKVPGWKVVRGSDEFADERHAVVKSLTLKRVAPGSVLYATRVSERDLDPSAPWFVQDYVDASADVTVVFVRRQLFAFELARQSFIARSIDWREVSLDPESGRWKPHRLPESMIHAITTYMGRLSLDYGRLDFLLRDNEYTFLEVNPHGEWGWLDPDGRHGLLDAILREVSPLTPTHPIPTTPGFAMRA